MEQGDDNNRKKIAKIFSSVTENKAWKARGKEKTLAFKKEGDRGFSPNNDKEHITVVLGEWQNVFNGQVVSIKYTDKNARRKLPPLLIDDNGDTFKSYRDSPEWNASPNKTRINALDKQLNVNRDTVGKLESASKRDAFGFNKAEHKKEQAAKKRAEAEKSKVKSEAKLSNDKDEEGLK
ncbi:hypothetical protein AWB78_08383 [Caballeronia calidae]|uniref:Uncharacterized protein n=1 Tax=Caballeronia calidae TaxID=1777139 RepID=A0A158EM82_9BURK|nr:hypothetical protein AWB78_08383 [Caballeronia calidae]